MPGTFQSSARPQQVQVPPAATRATVSTVGAVSPAQLVDGALVDELDVALFRAPFVLLTPENTSCGTTNSLAEARAALSARAEVATIAGQLATGLAGIDVDPADRGAEPEAGTACADALIHWTDDLGLPRVVRQSGRPGGHHIIVPVRSDELLDELRTITAQLAEHHGVSATVRAAGTLRLLSAPHRHGHPAPVVEAILTAADVANLPPALAGHVPIPTRGRGRRSAGGRGRRSETEFGTACAAARQGYTAAQAWAVASQPGTKARESGQLWWKAYVWLPAVTYVAADRQLGEDEAWSLAETACPTRARNLTRAGWRRLYWTKATGQAGTGRPRRLYIARATLTDEQRSKIRTLRVAFHATAHAYADEAHIRPQRRRSILAALDALAPILITKAGSLDSRTWAEHARVARSTVLSVRDELIAAGILALSHHYAGGAADCNAYALGTRMKAQLTTGSEETQTTRLYTPPPHTPPVRGRADLRRMLRRHARDRRAWALRCTLTDHCATTGETFSRSQHPAAKTLRSFWGQQKLWQARSPEEQEHRRELRRELLGRLEPADRAAWLAWLARRELVRLAAERVRSGELVEADRDGLAATPRTLHLGMRDPLWRNAGYAERAGAEQLGLAA